MDRYINITGHNTYTLNNNYKIYNVKSSRFLAPSIQKLKIIEPFRLSRIKRSMTYGVNNNEVFHYSDPRIISKIIYWKTLASLVKY